MSPGGRLPPGSRGFISDLPLRWSGQRVLVIGHRATHYAFEHVLGDMPLDELVGSGLAGQLGWECRLG